MAPTDQAKPTSTDKLMTPANIVTLARICLVPVFVVVLISPWPQWLGLPQVADDAKSLIAAGIFILISCTDWLDGYLARSRGEVTDFGKFMDPLADKILVAAALLALIELGSLPSWVALVILARRVHRVGRAHGGRQRGRGHSGQLVRQVQDRVPDGRHRAVLREGLLHGGQLERGALRLAVASEAGE